MAFTLSPQLPLRMPCPDLAPVPRAPGHYASLMEESFCRAGGSRRQVGELSFFLSRRVWFLKPTGFAPVANATSNLPHQLAAEHEEVLS